MSTDTLRRSFDDEIHALWERYLRDRDILVLEHGLGTNPSLVNARGSLVGTFLECAIAFDDVKAVELLINMGTNVNDARYCPPLFLAVERGTRAIPIVELLLKSGADVTARSVNDWTPLHLACSIGNTYAASLLLENNAEINARTRIDDFSTPIMEAADYGHKEIVILLLEHGADVSFEVGDVAMDQHGTHSKSKTVTREAAIDRFLHHYRRRLGARSDDIEREEANDRRV